MSSLYVLANEMLHAAARRLGFDFVRYEPTSHPLARRKRLLDNYRIGIVLDVGASIGGYGKQLREIGYRGKIVSFEPLNAAYQRLALHAGRDGAWTTHHCAIGDKNEKGMINIAGDSSSLLDMLPQHLDAAPATRYSGRQEIEIRTLDSLFSSLCTPGDNVYLKIDTQGFEDSVLDGAAESLAQIDTIQIELSLVPLYANASTLPDMHARLTRSGYTLVSLETGFTDARTGQLLQVDGIYRRMK